MIYLYHIILKFSLLCFINFSTFSSATELADICDGGYVYYFAQTNVNKALTFFDGVPTLDNIGLTTNDGSVYDASDVTQQYTDPTFEFDIEIPNDGNNHTGTVLGQEVTVNNFSFASSMILYPTESGDYTFSLSNVQGVVGVMLFADTDVYCCTSLGLNSYTLLAHLPDQGFDIPEVTVNLIEGMNYIFQIIYVNTEGSASMSLSYTDPNGVTHTNFDGIGQLMGPPSCSYYRSLSKVTSIWTGSYTTTYSTLVTTYTSDLKTSIDTIYYIQIPSSTSLVDSSTEYSSNVIISSSSQTITSSSEVTASSDIVISSSEVTTSSDIVTSSSEVTTSSDTVASSSEVKTSSYAVTSSSEIVTSGEMTSTPTTITKTTIESSPNSLVTSSSSDIKKSSSSVQSSSDLPSLSLNASLPNIISTSTSESDSSHVSIISSMVPTVSSQVQNESHLSGLSVSTTVQLSSVDTSKVSSNLVGSSIAYSSASSTLIKNSFSTDNVDMTGCSNHLTSRLSSMEIWNKNSVTTTAISFATGTVTNSFTSSISEYYDVNSVVHLSTYETSLTITSCNYCTSQKIENYNTDKTATKTAIETKTLKETEIRSSAFGSETLVATVLQTSNSNIMTDSAQNSIASKSIDTFLNGSYSFTSSYVFIFISFMCSFLLL